MRKSLSLKIIFPLKRQQNAGRFRKSAGRLSTSTRERAYLRTDKPTITRTSFLPYLDIHLRNKNGEFVFIGNFDDFLASKHP